LPLGQGVAWTCEKGANLQCNSDTDAKCWVEELHKQWCAASTCSEANTRIIALRNLWDVSCGNKVGAWKLGRGHAFRLRMARDLMDAFIQVGAWKKAARFSRDVCSVEAYVYPDPWPATAISHLRLARLEFMLNNLDAACSAARVAIRTFRVLGVDSGLMESAQHITKSAEFELCMLSSVNTKRYQTVRNTPPIANLPNNASTVCCDLNSMD